MSKARLVITALFVEQQSPAEIAARYGVHRAWVYKLKARYEAEGETALEPRSRRPRTSPNATPPRPSSWSHGCARSFARPATTQARTPRPSRDTDTHDRVRRDKTNKAGVSRSTASSAERLCGGGSWVASDRPRGTSPRRPPSYGRRRLRCYLTCLEKPLRTW